MSSRDLGWWASRGFPWVPVPSTALASPLEREMCPPMTCVRLNSPLLWQGSPLRLKDALREHGGLPRLRGGSRRHGERCLEVAALPSFLHVLQTVPEHWTWLQEV